MRVLFGLLLLLLCNLSVNGQSNPPSTPADTALLPASGAVLLFNGWYLPRYEPSAAEADTTGALLVMFRRQRTVGYAFMAPYFVGMCLSLPIASTNQYGQQVVADKAIAPAVGVPILAATVVGFVLHANAYNKKHLLTVNQAYAAGRPVPAKYRSRLKPQHFQEAATLRALLNEQMQYDQRHSQAK